MGKSAKAFSYLISAQVQAVTLILMAFWVGDWLNDNYQKDFNWYVVTFPISILAIVQTFYMVIKAALNLDKNSKKKD